MKYPLLFLLLIHSVISFSQIWQEAIDTSSSYEGPNQLMADLGVKSYTITSFDSIGKMTEFNYHEFDEKGLQTKHAYSASPNQVPDTGYYFYNEDGILQEVVTSTRPRQHNLTDTLQDSQNRIIARFFKSAVSSSEIRYHYSKAGHLDSITYSSGMIDIFEYNKDNKVTRKRTLKQGKLTNFVNYYYPNANTVAYCDCNRIKVWSDTITACDSTIGTFDNNERLIKVESHYYKMDGACYTSFKYDKDGKFLELTDETPSSKATTAYIRDKKGLLTKIEHRRANGNVYMYSEFDYQYR